MTPLLLIKAPNLLGLLLLLPCLLPVLLGSAEEAVKKALARPPC